jgi:hypothetical protein
MERKGDSDEEGCLVGNTLVHTSRGFFYLADICRKGKPLPGSFAQVHARLQQDAKESTGFYEHSKDVVTSSGYIYHSNAYYVNGFAHTVKLDLGNGCTLEGTWKHKVQVIDEETQTLVWTELNRLTLGKYVVCRVGLNIWPERQQLVLNNMVVRQEYWASVFAINLLPDFHYIDCSADMLYERCRGWLNCWGDLDFHVLPHILETKWGSLYRGIPRFILQGCRDVVIQYLSFLWYLTHELSKDKGEFMLMAPFRTVLVLQALLNNLGVTCNIVSMTPGRYNLVVLGKDSVMFMLNLFTRELSPFERQVYSELRSEAPVQFTTKPVEYPPLVGQVPAMNFREQFQAHILPDLQSKEFRRKMEAVCRHHEPGLDRQTLAQFSDLGLNVPDVFLDATYVFQKIKHMTFSEASQQTFDLSVPLVNSYLVQGGLISHNTVSEL